MVKNPPSMREIRVQSLGWEDPLEKRMATHSGIFLPGESHGQRSLEGYSPWARKESDTTKHNYYVKKKKKTNGIKMFRSGMFMIEKYLRK